LAQVVSFSSDSLFFSSSPMREQNGHNGCSSGNGLLKSESHELSEIGLGSGVTGSEYDSTEISTSVAMWQWFAMTCFQLVYSFINAGMGLYVLPTEAERLNGEDSKGIWVGIYVAIAGATQLICPIAGKMSDRHKSNLGRRRPFVIAGTALAIGSFAAMWLASARIWPWVYVLALGFSQIGLNVTYSAQCGLPADFQDSNGEDDGTKGIVSGILALHSFVGSLISVIMIMSTKGMPVQLEYPIAMAGLVLSCLLVCCSVDEVPTNSDRVEQKRLTCKEISKSFTIDLQRDRDFFWVCVGRGWFYMSTSIGAFLLYYIRDMFHFSEKEAQARLGILGIVAQVTGALTAVPSSRLSNVIGRKKVIYAATSLMITAFALYIVAPKVGSDGSWELVLFTGMIYGSGSGAYLSVDYALALDCLPVSKTTAEAFGLWGVAGFIGAATGPVLGGLILTFLGSENNDFTYLGYSVMMFVLGCCSNMLCAFFTTKIQSAT